MATKSENKGIWKYGDKWEEELLFLKSILDKTELTETTKWGGPVYVYQKKNVVGLGGFKDYFAIWFFNGVFLKDEKKKLINAQEEVTKSLRQWRFTSKEEVNEKDVLEYIHEAIENEKQGKIIKPSKKEVIVSELLEKEMAQNPALKEAFAKFSPYKQYEFLEYIESAKQEKTKLSRIEKVLPMILANVGLNDKYRQFFEIPNFLNPEASGPNSKLYETFVKVLNFYKGFFVLSHCEERRSPQVAPQRLAI